MRAGQRLDRIVNIVASNRFRPLLLMRMRAIVIGKDEENLGAAASQFQADVVEETFDSADDGAAGIQQANLHDGARNCAIPSHGSVSGSRGSLLSRRMARVDQVGVVSAMTAAGR